MFSGGEKTLSLYTVGTFASKTLIVFFSFHTLDLPDTGLGSAKTVFFNRSRPGNFLQIHAWQPFFLTSGGVFPMVSAAILCA